MKKKRIIHSALSLSLTAALCLSMAACGGTQTPADSGAASQPAAPSAAVQPSSAQTTSASLPVKALNPKQVEENPYMAKSCLLYTSPSPRDPKTSRMPSSA